MMGELERLGWFLLALSACISLFCIADCLDSLTDSITVELVSAPESSGDKAATSGSE